MNLNIERKFHMVHDNCKIQVAKFSKELFKIQNFEVIQWPFKSPNINLMETFEKCSQIYFNQIVNQRMPKNCRKNYLKQQQIFIVLFKKYSQRHWINKLITLICDVQVARFCTFEDGNFDGFQNV